MSLYRFDTVSARIWAFAQMGFARVPLMMEKNLSFWKLLGTGIGEGFTPIPNTKVYAILTVWPDLETAKARLSKARVFQRYKNRADNSWTLFMAATSVRGTWAKKAPFESQEFASQSNLVALTRATIRPSILFQFWQRVPNISKVIGSDPNVRFKIGLGEIPWFRQITFSIWPDDGSMANFARKDGPHAKAIKAVREGNWFKEELYARFHILEEDGHWSQDTKDAT